MNGYIYKTTNIITGKIYIGQSIVTKRIKSYLGSGKLLIRAINKYGKENFIKEILIENIDNKHDIDLLEIRCINEYNTVSPHGYNLEKGGNGKCEVHQSTKDKLHDIHKGKQYNPMVDATKEKIRETLKGHVISEETKTLISKNTKIAMQDPKIRAKISLAKKGKPSHNKGKRMTEEQKEKISNSKKGTIPWNKGMKFIKNVA